MSIEVLRRTARRLTCLGIVATAAIATATPAADAADTHSARGGDSIIGGYTPHPSQWPWMVSISLGHTGSDFDQHYCGGALIQQRLVVTAAHCVVDSDTNTVRAPSSYSVVIGKRQLSAAGGEHLSVVRIDVHPRYGSPTRLSHDLAVLHLGASSVAQPAALIGTQASLSVGSRVTTMGWGNTQSGGSVYAPSDTLKAVDAGVWSDAQCRAAGINARDRANYSTLYDPASMICSQFSDISDTTCQGDSGSPMMIPDTAGVWRLVGMVSWGGIGCYGQTSPSVYAWLGASDMDAFVRQSIQAADAALVIPSGQPGSTTTGQQPVGGTTTTSTTTATSTVATTVSLRASLATRSVRRGRSVRVLGAAGQPGTLKVSLYRGARRVSARALSVPRAGAFAFALATRQAGRPLPRGRYTVRMVLSSGSGSSPAIMRAFRVR
jgi:secreted trypsin-like serine protease